MIASNDAPALPLWVDGHAILMMADRFLDVADPASGKVLRRVPLYGAEAVDKAVASAASAHAGWQALTASARLAQLAAVAEALAPLATHFAKLIASETGRTRAEAGEEVDAAIAALRAPAALDATGIVAALSDDSRPLAGPATLIAAALAAGAVVIAKPSPRAPGAAFALAELASRAGLPDGVFNLVQGDDEAVAALCAHAGVSGLIYAGGDVLAEKLAPLAAARGKAFTGLA